MSISRCLFGAALFFCLVCAAFSQNLQGFNIGTSPNQIDVAFNGEEQGVWNPSKGPNEFDMLSWPPAVYYVWIDPQVVGYDTATFTVTAEFSGSIELNVTSAQVTVSKTGDNYHLLAPLLCASVGKSQGKIEITINDPPGKKPVVLFIEKDCEFPSFNVGFRCSKGYCPKVIDDNVVDTQWLDNNYIVGVNEEIPWFYIWVNDSFVPWAEFQVYVSNDQPLNLVSQYRLPYGDNATAFIVTSEHASLDIDLTCQSNRLPSLSNISVTIAPKYWDVTGALFAKNSVTFHIGKRCGDITGNSRQGFNIGTTPKGSDVVSNGATVFGYRDFNRPWNLDSNFKPFNLYFSANAAAGFSDSLFYNITFAEEFADNVAVSTEEGKLDATLMVGGPEQTVKVDFDCVKNGVERIVVTVDVSSNAQHTIIYDHMVIFFQKECVLPGIDITFAGDNSALMQNNKRTYQSMYWSHTAPASTLTDNFLVSLNSQSPVQEQNIIITTDSDSAFLALSVNQPALSIAGLGNPVTVTVQYNCVVDKPSTSNVSWTIDFGWEESWTVAYSKECNTTSGSSGWNAASIFFFTVFILLLAFFIFGSMYKYFFQQQRGWDIIPGITYYRKCCPCCPGSSARYTPQMDSDYVATEDGRSKHTTYGTHTYQPNL